MKTYPYQDGDRLIQLVEKRELDQLLERLAEARESHLAASARDVQTIQRQAIMLDRLAGALKEIAWVRETGNRGYSWTGDRAFVALSAYESANLEPVANPVDEAVKRVQAVPVDDLRNEYMETLADELHSFEDRDKPFTTEVLTNTALEAVRTRLINAAKAELAAMKKVIRKIYYETETCADGAPDATAHDKLCNEVSSQLEPYIK